MILQWNAGALQQLAQGGLDAFNWSASTTAAPVSVAVELGARFEWTERRTRVRKRFEPEVPAPIVEAAIAEIDALPTAPGQPELAAAMQRIARTMGPYWSEVYRGRIADEIRSHLDITEDELATVLMLLAD